MDTDTASEIVLAEHPVISDTAEGVESSLLDLLIANLNTLAVVYQKNPDQFVKKAEIHEERENEDEEDDDDDDDAVTGVSRPNSAAVERSDSLMEREKREGGCELRVSDLCENHSLMKTVW